MRAECILYMIESAIHDFGYVTRLSELGLRCVSITKDRRPLRNVWLVMCCGRYTLYFQVVMLKLHYIQTSTKHHPTTTIALVCVYKYAWGNFSPGGRRVLFAAGSEKFPHNVLRNAWFYIHAYVNGSVCVSVCVLSINFSLPCISSSPTEVYNHISRYRSMEKWKV